jgi:hypothetical protein
VAGWSALPFRVEGLVAYQYEVVLRDGTFDVIARGDLNGDGVTSLFTLHGDTMKLSTEREFE